MINNKFLFGIVILALVTGLLFYGADESEPQIETAESNIPPSISYLDILNNPEFKSKMVSATRENNTDTLAELQEKAVQIGKAANLSPDEMALLSGEKGLRFMQFRAKRDMFLEEFTNHYNQLLPINTLKSRYPEAADMFDKADSMIAERDDNIIRIARQLAGTDNVEPFLSQARQQWKDRAAAEAAAALAN